MGNFVHVLMLSIQALRGLRCLHAPGIVPCIISFSRQLPCFLMVWPQYASFFVLTVSNSSLFTPALLRTHSFIVFFAVHKTHRIFLSPFISKASSCVSSFFLRVPLSQPYVATGHTSTFISRIFVEIGMLWLFHIFCSDAPITCPLFNLARNSVVHSPSSVIRDPRYAPVVHSEWVYGTLCRRLPLPWSRRRWWVGCICGYRRSTNSCSSASEVANRMMSSA